jgi:hypothetical protein
MLQPSLKNKSSEMHENGKKVKMCIQVDPFKAEKDDQILILLQAERELQYPVSFFEACSNKSIIFEKTDEAQLIQKPQRDQRTLRR